MSYFSFQKALVQSPKRSRLDLGCTKYVGMRFGMMTPTYNTFIVPSDEVTASMEQVCRLAPMPVPTFVDMVARHDFFFCPLRILYSDAVFQRLFDVQASGSAAAESRASFEYADLVANINLESAQSGIKEPILPLPGTLWDYLGYPVLSDSNINYATDEGLEDLLRVYLSDPSDVSEHDNLRLAFSTDGSIANLPLLCAEPIFVYHFIWRDWYRFTGVQPAVGPVEAYLDNHCLDIAVDDSLSGFSSTEQASEVFNRFLVAQPNDQINLADLLYRPRYVHFRPDGFTSVRYGTKPVVLIPTGQSGNIPNLREASAWQRVVDIFSIAGSRLFDRIRAVFNVLPDGFADDRVQFLARYQAYIKIGEVLTTATTTEASTGDYAGRGILIDGKYLFRRRFTEYGWLMCISSVVPSIAYNGISRQLTDISLFDTPVPQLAEVGDQSVFDREVNFLFSGSQDSSFGTSVFGSQFRYYAYKWSPDSVHGSFRMKSMLPWSPLNNTSTQMNVVNWSKVYPEVWNKVFNDTDNELVFGDRFFFKLDFHVSISRPLPKYINYHL